MKIKSMRVVSIVLILILSLSSVAMAVSPRSSSYINRCSATASASGSGKITVTFNISCTGIMTSLGATKIEIKNSSGTTLKTYNSTDVGYSDMMGSNKITHSGSVVYQGTQGNTYYAVISFKAANNYGSDVDSVTTTFVKAS